MNEEEKRKIEDFLDKLEAPISLRGYKFWIEAISLYLENGDLRMGDIYEKIANKYNLNWTSVERAMRHLHQRRKKEIQDCLGVTYKITNINFLYLAVRNIRRES